MQTNMKKLSLIAALALVSLAAQAQTWQDAMLFSENNYVGTARSVGMGNAVTALGGDAGSIGFNPAGSAVAGYSQFVMTPALSISSAYATGTIYEGWDAPVGFQDGVSSGFTRFKMPNIGAITSFNTGSRSGLRRISMGFVMNSTNDFTQRFNASGVNRDNSFAAALASLADGYATSVMSNESWYATGDPARMPSWISMTGYRSGMMDAVDGNDGAYVAATERMDDSGNFRLAGPINQRYGRQSTGSKNDYILNFAADFSDVFYIGANIGIVSLRYRQNEYWQESPEDPSTFPTIGYSDGTTRQFRQLIMKRAYRASGSGIYAKAGFLWRPFDGLRLAAAISTPTVIDIEERYGYEGETHYNSGVISASSPEDEWFYQLRSPFRVNAGLAYTIGSVASLSADYEFTNYSHARYRAVDEEGYEIYDDATFADVNADIRDLCGAQHILRLGGELRPTPQLAIRVGYNYITSPQHAEFRGGQVVLLNEDEYRERSRTNVSFGFGYSSAGSFFLDGALRFNFMPFEYIIPYDYYTVPAGAQFYNKVADASVPVPEISMKSTLIDVLVTCGWRF